jgi:RHS repeat-associated protein
VVATTNAIGDCVFKTNAITELATGMHRQVNGEWVESQPTIVPTSTGAAFVGASHEGFLAANLNTRAAVQLETPQGNWIKGNVLGLAYYDPATSNSVLIAQVKDSYGVIQNKCQVLYTNALTDIRADVRYTYTRAGFEQDVILREQPPAPEVYGLSGETSQLIVITEFLDTPAPKKVVLPRPEDALASAGLADVVLERPAQLTNQSGTAQDEILSLNGMRIGFGRAFRIGSDIVKRLVEGERIPVRRNWKAQSGRHFLIERVNFKDTQGQLKELPQFSKVGQRPKAEGLRHQLMDHLPVPEALLAAGESRPMLVATVAAGDPGFVLDWWLYPGEESASQYWFTNPSDEYLVTAPFLTDTAYFGNGVIVRFPTPDVAYMLGIQVPGDSPYTGIFVNEAWTVSYNYNPGFTHGIASVCFTSIADTTVGYTGFAESYFGGFYGGNPHFGPNYAGMSDYPQALTISGGQATLDFAEVRYAALGFGFVHSAGQLNNCCFKDCGIAVSAVDNSSVGGSAEFYTSPGTYYWVYPIPYPGPIDPWPFFWNYPGGGYSAFSPAPQDYEILRPGWPYSPIHTGQVSHDTTSQNTLPVEPANLLGTKWDGYPAPYDRDANESIDYLERLAPMLPGPEPAAVIAFFSSDYGNISDWNLGAEHVDETQLALPSVCGKGMPGWWISEPFLSLWLSDVPLFYSSSVGPVGLRLNYNSQGRSRANGYKDNRFSGFGDFWECEWLEMVRVQSDGAGGVTVKRYRGDGGIQNYSANGAAQFNSGGSYNGSTAGMASITTPTGMKYVYGGYPDAVDAGPDVTNLYLAVIYNKLGQVERSLTYTSTADSKGSKVVLLTTVTDLDGKSVTLGYADPVYPYLITSATDPYGRTANFAYIEGRLTGITDMIGMPTSFSPDASGTITSMTTLYGTTGFEHIIETAGPNRAIKINEPNGKSQLYAYRPDCTKDGGSVAGSYSTLDPSPQLRNTFHWDRKQFELLTGTTYLDLPLADYYTASMKHWLKTADGVAVSDTLAAEAGPVLAATGNSRSHRVCYEYPGQTDPSKVGTSSQPSKTTWDGTAYQQNVSSSVVTLRNRWGNPTNIITYLNGQTYTSVLAYDASGRILQSVTGPHGEPLQSLVYDPQNPFLLRSVTDAQQGVTLFDYDGNLRVHQITSAGGQVTINNYFAGGDSPGFLQSQVQVGVATNSFTYQNGNVHVWTDALGLVRTQSWDNLNRLTNVDYPDGTRQAILYDKLDVVGVKDRTDHWTRYFYDPVRQLSTVTNATNGLAVTLDYCGCGSPSTITRYGETENQTTTIDYNLAGQKTYVLHPDNYSETYVYNDLGRLTSSFDNAGHTNTPTYGDNDTTTQIAIGPNTSPLTVLRQAFDEYGRLTSATNANGVVVTNGYDHLNRIIVRHLVTTTGLSNQRFEYTARGLTNAFDEFNHVTKFVNNAMGLTLSRTNANDESLDFTHNAVGQLLSLADGKGQMTTWHYDQYGRVDKKFDANNAEIIRYQYDADGRLTNRWTVAKGDTAYFYDGLGQLTNVLYSGGSMSVTLKYDGFGRLKTLVDGLGTHNFTYNAAGQLLTEDGPWSDDTVTCGYLNRQRSSLTVTQPSGTWGQTYLYDVYGRLTNVTSPAGGFGYIYKAGTLSLISRLSLPNGHYVTNTYDDLARLTSTTLVTANGAVANAHRYELNVGHQRTGQVFTNTLLPLAGQSMGYSYDGIGQLKAAQGTNADGMTFWTGNQFGYDYDPAWNLAHRTNSGTVESFTVDNLNQLAPPPVYVYDANGNLRTNGSEVLEYDGENRMTNVYVSGQWRTEFRYDGFNRMRVRREFDGGGSLAFENRYIYDGMLVVQERDENNTPVVTYTRGLDLSGGLQAAGGIGGLLARTQHTGTNTGTGFYHCDGNGNVTAVLAPDGQTLLAAYLYDPFGGLLQSSGTWKDANVYRFSSKEFHAKSGLCYYGYRFYSPGLQRWINRDLIGEPGGINLYAYVGNNPINGADQLGLWNLWNPATWGDKNPQNWSFWNSITPWHESSGFTRNGWDGHYRLLYTGNSSSSDEVYDQATSAAGAYLYCNSPIRGAYFFAGVHGRSVEGLGLLGYELDHGGYTGWIGAAGFSALGVGVATGVEQIDGGPLMPIVIGDVGVGVGGVGGFWSGQPDGRSEVGIFIYGNYGGGLVGGGYTFDPSKLKNFLSSDYWKGNMPGDDDD